MFKFYQAWIQLHLVMLMNSTRRHSESEPQILDAGRISNIRSSLNSCGFFLKLCILVYLRNVLIMLMQICISRITTTSYIELTWYADPFRYSFRREFIINKKKGTDLVAIFLFIRT